MECRASTEATRRVCWPTCPTRRSGGDFTTSIKVRPIAFHDLFDDFTIFLQIPDELYKVLPEDFSQLLIQCIAGSFGGFTTTIITNPLDIIRARLQVQRMDSFALAARELWSEEQFHMFFKGLSARLVQSAAFSFSIILGYETIKRISVNSEYTHMVRW